MSITVTGNASIAGNGFSEDRAKELKDFDETKAGVKGLADAGVATIPRIFIHAPEHLPCSTPSTQSHPMVPLIDLAGIDDDHCRAEMIDVVRRASETWGFFQVVNHRVPVNVMEEMIKGVHSFNEQPKEVKMQYYTNDLRKNVRCFSNFDLYQARAANWRDTIVCALAPGPIQPEDLPAVCRFLGFLPFWNP